MLPISFIIAFVLSAMVFTDSAREPSSSFERTSIRSPERSPLAIAEIFDCILSTVFIKRFTTREIISVFTTNASAIIPAKIAMMISGKLM